MKPTTWATNLGMLWTVTGTGEICIRRNLYVPFTDHLS